MVRRQRQAGILHKRWVFNYETFSSRWMGRSTRIPATNPHIDFIECNLVHLPVSVMCKKYFDEK